MTLRELLLIAVILNTTLSDPPSKATRSSSTGSDLFSIDRSSTNPETEVLVTLPSRHPLYTQFIAKVYDVTTTSDDSILDQNRTFLSEHDRTPLRINNLHPGHKYSITIVGRNGDKSEQIKEEILTIAPRAPVFPAHGIIVGETNVTLKTEKEANAVQDSFLIETRQLKPEKKLPDLEVLDIPDQSQLEIYLGNLLSGEEYSIRVTASRDGVLSRPWTTIITTKPNVPVDVHVAENGSCVELQWKSSSASSADGFALSYAPIDAKSQLIQVESRQWLWEKNLSQVFSSVFCDELEGGRTYEFSLKTLKNDVLSTAVTVNYSVKPHAPTDFKVKADVKKGKYRIFSELSYASRYDKCVLSVVSETLDAVTSEAVVEEKNGKKTCTLWVSLSPGERFEFSLWTEKGLRASQKLHRSHVLSPAFDLHDFGINIQEIRGGLELAWPQSEVFMTRMKDVWNKVVGTDSQLQLRVSPVITASSSASTSSLKTRQFESSPIKSHPVFVNNLVAGACYKVQVYTVTRSGIVSETRYEEKKRLSAPAVNVTLLAVARNTATLTLIMINPEEVSADCQLSISVLDMHSQIVFDKRLSVSKIIPSIQLQGLRPFHKYTVNTQIQCGLGNDSDRSCTPSTRVMRQVSFSTRQDKPGPVQHIKAKALNPYSVQLTWMPPALPNGLITHYMTDVLPEQPNFLKSSSANSVSILFFVSRILVVQKDSQASWRVNVSSSSERTADHGMNVVVDNLRGGETYEFMVRAVTEAGVGEELPAGLLAITMPVMAPPQPHVGPEILTEELSTTSVSIRYSTDIFNPKHGRVLRSAVLVNEVTDDGRVSDTWMQVNNNTYTWAQVQRFDVWPAYTATINDLDEALTQQATAVTERIGMEQTCRDLDEDQICNGPLRPGRKYKFRIRLFTAPNLYSDSPYSQVITTESEAAGLPLRVLVLLLSLVVFLGLSGVLILTLCSRSKKNKHRSKKDNLPELGDRSTASKETQWAALKMIMAERAADCLAKLGLDSQNVPPSNNICQTDSTLQPPFGHHRRCRSLRERTGVDHRLERLPSGPLHKTPLYTVIPGANAYKSRPVRVADFAEHVRMMSADSDFRFSEEYEMLKNVGVGQALQAAEAAVNRPKNRFTNILPYEHSRIRLKDVGPEEGADYINANLIPGFSSRKEFIAAQGPLPSTRDDFWQWTKFLQMVWEEDCPAIVALTKCVEKGRDKCHQYWPEADRPTLLYGIIEVSLLCEAHFDEFTVRELRLTHARDRDASRIVRHFHYMAWPDFGVPEHPDGIIRFARLFRSKLPHSQLNNPTIVHCSAGVGRSGTFMAIDRLLHTISMERPIDVFGIVYEMRLERCHMVQNEQQYIFIHQCILRALESGASEWANIAPSSVEIHQNPAFEDDDIAESGF